MEQAAYDVLAQAYDRLMGEVDYGAWYTFYRALFAHVGVERPSSAADICCGTGEFTLRLAKEGIKTVGIDRSEAMLMRAREKALEQGARVTFAQMDAAKFSLHRPCDMVLCACDGVNYLSSPQAAQSFFASAWAALSPGGALAFDVSTAYKMQHLLDGRAYGEDFDDLCYLWRNDYEQERRLCHMELTIFTRQIDGRYARAFERHIQRAHSRQELESWLTAAGFADIAFFSDREMIPPRDEDWRMHVVARKRP